MSTSTKGNPCFRRRAQEVADAILKAFQENTLPKALAPVFVHRTDNVPCRSWSWANQLMAAIHGHCDARGYRQWEQTGRHVKKGEKAFPILVPMCKKKKAKDEETGTDETGDEKTKTYVYGFTSAPVFGLNQTEGEPLPPPSAGIALSVENLSTWAHELCHAADDRLGNLQERGQHWRSETVAELGGAILLETLGHDTDSDRGGCWEYVSAYAKDAKITPITACQCVLNRTCDAVALILDTANAIKQGA